MLQHDVDHGSANKAAKKHKHLKTVFEIYSGSPSPDAVDPAKFILVQVNILAAVTSDLNALAKSFV
jgi:hypothetical protein